MNRRLLRSIAGRWDASEDRGILQIRREDEEPHLGGDDGAYRLMVDAMNEGAVSFTSEGVILFANRRLGELLGQDPGRIVGGKLQSFVAPEDVEQLEFIIRTAGTRAGTANFNLVAAEGRKAPVRLVIRSGDAGGRTVLVGVMSELTESFTAQASIDALNRELERAADAKAQAKRAAELIIASSRAVIEAAEEKKLLLDICRAVVDVGGYRLAWVGLAEDAEARFVELAALVGPHDDFLAEERISGWEKMEAGRSPTAEAIRSGQTVITWDNPEDATLISWRSLASKSGFRSSAAIPFKFDSQTTGAMIVCSEHPNAFDGEEVELLAQVAGALAFGIGALRARIALAAGATPSPPQIQVAAQPVAAELAELELGRADRLGAWLGATTDGFWRMDGEGRLLEVNEAYCRMSGYSQAELLAMTIAQLEEAAAPEGVAARLQAASAKGFERFTTRHRRKDASAFDVEVSLTHWPQTGQFLGFVREPPQGAGAGAGPAPLALEPAGLLEASLEPMLMIAPDGKITGANAAALQAIGSDREKLIGQDFAGCFTDPRRAGDGLQEVLQKGLVRDIALSLKQPSGAAMDVTCNATVLRDADGKPMRVLAALRDVSQAARTEFELRRDRDRLERTVEARTVELAATTKDLEAFAYSVSHDLRAPLRAVDGFSRILLEDYGVKIDAEGQHALAVIREAAQKMSRMIDEILAFSRAGRLEMKSEPLDMDGLVRGVLDELQPELEGRNLKLDVSRLPAGVGDEGLIRRVWKTLLGGAIKATSSRPEGRIEVTSMPGDAETIYVVRDNGVGFDMAYVDKLFSMTNVPGAEYPGAGMGLAIARRIMGRHGGRVWAEGRPGEGSSFYFSLPQPVGGGPVGSLPQA